jgi:thioredoxin-dependent peroxiredoxin
MAKAPELQLKTGDVAPDFSAVTTDGSRIELSRLRGKHVVLYFYPKDDTPGCTKEACAFRDAFPDFTAAGAVVLGVSTDPVRSHVRFTEKFRLPFPLIADEDRSVVNAYGAWGEKTFMGRRYQGTFRITYHIGPDGLIRNIWPQVKPELHAAEVLKAIQG